MAVELDHTRQIIIAVNREVTEHVGINTSVWGELTWVLREY
jgi:hypothetical protein